MCEYQVESLPEPFPIRIPLGFFVKGRCGNRLIHIERLVRSGLREARFKKILNRKIRFAVVL